jgi:hypothetical protein
MWKRQKAHRERIIFESGAVLEGENYPLNPNEYITIAKEAGNRALSSQAPESIVHESELSEPTTK